MQRRKQCNRTIVVLLNMAILGAHLSTALAPAPPLAPLPSPAAHNVSCIAHDAKFTCDCGWAEGPMLLPRLFGAAFQVEISNCRSLTVDANALEGTQGLRKVTFRHIDSLVLRQYALAFPPHTSNAALILEFEKVRLQLIDSHAINGHIEEITFTDSHIDVVNPFAFTILKKRALLLKLDGVTISKIEPQALKKFVVEELEVANCTFESDVPSKAFYELEVQNALRISNVRFREVRSHAFSFKMISRLTLVNNHFEAVEAEWIEAQVQKSATIRDNHFGTTSPIAFRGITVHRDYVASERLELRFHNNTVRFSAQAQPLHFNELFALNIQRLRYENAFTCADVDRTQQPPRPKLDFFNEYRESLFFRREQAKQEAFVALSEIVETDCLRKSYLLYVVGGVSVLALAIVAAALITWQRVARKRRARRKLDVIHPEPRTYKETQIVYQIENAGLLKTDL